MPISTASTRPTTAWPWMKLPSTLHDRVRTTSRCRPARCPTSRRSHGRNFGPSLRKKKVSTSARKNVTRPLPTAPRPGQQAARDGRRTPAQLLVRLVDERGDLPLAQVEGAPGHVGLQLLQAARGAPRDGADLVDDLRGEHGEEPDDRDQRTEHHDQGGERRRDAVPPEPRRRGPEHAGQQQREHDREHDDVEVAEQLVEQVAADGDEDQAQAPGRQPGQAVADLGAALAVVLRGAGPGVGPGVGARRGHRRRMPCAPRRTR